MKRYLRKTLQDTLTVWIILAGGIITASILYACLAMVGIPENIRLLISLAILLGIVIPLLQTWKPWKNSPKSQPKKPHS